MIHYNQDWDELGRNIQDIVDRAINSQDYQKLNQTIRQVVDRAVDLKNETVRKAAAASGSYRSTAQQTAPSQTQPALYGSTSRRTAVGTVKAVGGSLLCGVSFLLLLVAALFGSLLPLTLGIGGFCAGAGVLASGVRTLGMVRRFKTYRRTLADKTHCTLEKLARGVGRDVKFVRKELLRMIRDGLFLEGHLNNEQTCLITSHETYQLFERSRLQLEQRQRREAEEQARKAAVTREPQVQEVLDRGNAFVAEIRRCNDEIPGEAVSAKIDRMENIVRRIFQRAEAHPEIVPDLKKLMDYYLPMTVKLLNAYADMDAQPIQGETIQTSKREIEATLDTLNLAFEKLLDDLFADTALDVSSDISVLNTLLAQEGLTEDELTKMRKQQNGC